MSSIRSNSTDVEAEKLQFFNFNLRSEICNLKFHACIIALSAALFSLWLCRSQFGLLPHISDEVSYVLQGRILASGRLWIEPPPIPGLLDLGHILITKERMCSVYPPGWPLLLMLGWWMRAPWLMNPVLLGASILLLYRLASQIYDQRVALAAVALFAASPFVLEMHSGFMSHPSLLCGALVFCVTLQTGARSGRRLHFAIAGAAAGLCFLIRPFTAVVLLAPFAIWCVAKRKRMLLYCAAGAVPFLLLYLAYNLAVFGSALSSGYLQDPAFPENPVSARFFAGNFWWYFQEFNRRLWEWPFPNLIVFLPLLAIRRLRKADFVFGICVLSLIVGYSFYYYHDIVLGGPRFAFEATAFLSILAARSLWLAADFAHKLVPRVRPGVYLLAFVFTGAGYSLFARMPEQWLYHSASYHGQDHTLVELLRNLNTGEDALVLVSSRDFAVGAFYFENALPPESGSRVFVRDLKGKEQEIRNIYPRKNTWRLRVKIHRLPRSPNSYTDRWSLPTVTLERLRGVRSSGSISE